MKLIYVVMGTTGECSDRGEWPVYAFSSEEAAQRHAMKCQDWYLANVERRANGRVNTSIIYKNPFDPSMDVDYTGTRWYVMTVEMGDDTP